MIDVKCIPLNTLNKYTDESWPTKMAVRPLKGDMVRAESGKQWLTVTNVCHATIKTSAKSPGGTNYMSCVIGLEVYLSK